MPKLAKQPDPGTATARPLATQPHRLAIGGRIDRSQQLAFTFDGRKYVGLGGDSLASALLANGVHLVGRSMKYHRPRGILSAGVEEPNALVTLHADDRRDPNVPATTIELFDGLIAESQNRWPSLSCDLMSVVDRMSSLVTAGFYYKTFMGPTRKAWKIYEGTIRRTAGLGRAPRVADPDRYERAQAFCDVLIVGAGPAGLVAALAAGLSGARVMLVEEGASLGGSILAEPIAAPSNAWLSTVTAKLGALPNVRVLTRTTAFGAYDNMVVGLLERSGDHLRAPEPYQPRQRFWTVHARDIVLATGMIERPIVFGNNDVPGVMLAAAARSYLNRHAVLVGRDIVVFTNNDSAYVAAFDLAGAGAKVSVIDTRRAISEKLRREAQQAQIELHLESAVARAGGRLRVKSADVTPYDRDITHAAPLKVSLPCDTLLVSGGWTPTLQLLGQRGSRPVYDAERSMFIAGTVPSGYRLAGASSTEVALKPCITSAWKAGSAAAAACRFAPLEAPGFVFDGLPDEDATVWGETVTAIADPARSKRAKKFVDFQHDVGLDDIAQAMSEGYESVEHLKRYTTLGMASDQGKTANANALAIASDLLKRPINAVGTTTFRPPYRPLTIGAVAGPEFGPHFKPTRRSPMHECHIRDGAVFTAAGLWQRAWYYPRSGETSRDASIREATAVRQNVGMVDISSLGKIDIQGPDAATFLDRIYVNSFATLAVGRARYGVMLRLDGIVMDDGTTSRLSENRYFMTTTTAGAGKVMTFLEYLLQTAWPDLRVNVTSVTSQWAGIAVAGPRSRDLLRGLVADCDFGNDSFPFMGVRHGHLGGIPVRLLRISFSGELAYEVYTAAGYGERLWETVREAGRAGGLVLYGTEALGILRIEKGHVAGAELDGRTTLTDLGLGRMASKKKPFIGSALKEREGLTDPARPQLVGLEVCQPNVSFRAGAILCEPGCHKGHGIGFVSSVTYSPTLARHIGLGFVSGGASRSGQIVDAVSALRREVTAVRVRSPHFVDPDGERLRA